MCQVVMGDGTGGGGDGVRVCACVCVWCGACGRWGVWVWQGNSREKEKIGRAMNRKKGDNVPIAGFKSTIVPVK